MSLSLFHLSLRITSWHLSTPRFILVFVDRARMQRLRTSEEREREREKGRVSNRARSENGTLSRVNRANEAVWLRQGRRLYFSLTHRALVRLSVHPSVRRLRGISLSFSLELRSRAKTKKKRRTPWWIVASGRLTWHAVPLDKNVTRTKLTPLSRSFPAPT